MCPRSFPFTQAGSLETKEHKTYRGVWVYDGQSRLCLELGQLEDKGFSALWYSIWMLVSPPPQSTLTYKAQKRRYHLGRAASGWWMSTRETSLISKWDPDYCQYFIFSSAQRSKQYHWLPENRESLLFWRRWWFGTALVVQWLRLRALSAEGLGSIPGQGTRSHVLQLKPSVAK